MFIELYSSFYYNNKLQSNLVYNLNFLYVLTYLSFGVHVFIAYFINK